MPFLSREYQGEGFQGRKHDLVGLSKRMDKLLLGWGASVTEKIIVMGN